MNALSPHATRRFAALFLWTGTLLGGTGCPPSPREPVVEDRPTPPPPRELREIIAAIEANTARLDRALWSNNVLVTARFEDEEGKDHVYNLDSNLFFQRPRNFRMDLRPGLGDQVMQIGSNERDYWVWIEADLNRMAWGRHEYVGRPCVKRIIVRPDELIAALGVGGLPDSSTGLHGPIRRYGKKYDILRYDRRQPEGEWLLDRDYWIERVSPYQIRLIRVFDGFGRVTMSAFLEDFRAAWDEGPSVAHAINVIWPERGKFTMRIGSLRGIAHEEVKSGSFDRPPLDRLPPNVRANVLQVDSDCDEAPATGEPGGERSDDGGAH